MYREIGEHIGDHALEESAIKMRLRCSGAGEVASLASGESMIIHRTSDRDSPGCGRTDETLPALYWKSRTTVCAVTPLWSVNHTIVMPVPGKNRSMGNDPTQHPP